MSIENVPDDLKQLLIEGDFLLFLGAGVGLEAGLPDWSTSLQLLAERLKPFASSWAGLMFEEAKAGRYLESAELLYMAPISDARRAELLTAVFGAPASTSRRLKLLLKSRCQGFVTTNFDRSLEAAAADAAVDLIRYTESDDDLANARVCQSPYLLRLHGRIEVPTSLVFSSSHFKQVVDREPYVEFFRHIFLNRNIVFFGYSFRDPILNVLLSEISKAVRSVFKRRAFALLPGPVEADLRKALQKLAIDVVEYDPHSEHDEAWSLLANYRGSEPVVGPEIYEAQNLRSHLASVYARVKARQFSADRARTLAGLMAALLPGIRKPIPLDDFLKEVETKLALPPSLGRSLVVEATKILESDGVVTLTGDTIAVKALPTTDAFETDANRLLAGIASRALIRNRREIPPGLLPKVREAIMFALTLDGLHLAHSLMRSTPLDRARVRPTIDQAVQQAGLAGGNYGIVVGDLIEQLMTRPDPEEERVLANVSVAAFSTALLLEDPLLAQSADAKFEAGAYVDASVLLPWLCDGHPLNGPYTSVLAAFGNGQIKVMSGYLNELVSHRNLAIEAMDRGRLDEASLKRYVGLFELHNINTFVAGYAGKKALGFAGTFQDYLAEVAPFDSEAAAAKFLTGRGIIVEPMSPRRPGSSFHGELKAALKDARRFRDDVVVEHDSRQIELLASSELSAVFITADRSLVGAVSRTRLVRVVRRMLLPGQAAYLAQIVARGKAGFEGIVRAMWSMGDDMAAKVRRFYTDRILKEYEFALVSEAPAVVEAMLAEIARAGIDVGADAPRGESEEERLKLFTALDRFEPQFFEKLADAKRRAGLTGQS